MISVASDWPTLDRCHKGVREIPLATHGIGRICTISGCETRLSQYNPTDICALHAGGWEKAQPQKTKDTTKPEPIICTCAFEPCGKEFLTTNANRQYCSSRCSLLASNAMRGPEPIEKFKQKNSQTPQLKRKFTDQTLSVLAFLIKDPSKKHYGLEISRGTRLGSSTIYPILSRLVRDGWLENDWDKTNSKHPRRYYHFTTGGELAAWDSLR